MKSLTTIALLSVMASKACGAGSSAPLDPPPVGKGPAAASAAAPAVGRVMDPLAAFDRRLIAKREALLVGIEDPVAASDRMEKLSAERAALGDVAGVAFWQGKLEALMIKVAGSDEEIFGDDDLLLMDKPCPADSGSVSSQSSGITVTDSPVLLGSSSPRKK